MMNRQRSRKSQNPQRNAARGLDLVNGWWKHENALAAAAEKQVAAHLIDDAFPGAGGDPASTAGELMWPAGRHARGARQQRETTRVERDVSLHPSGVLSSSYSAISLCFMHLPHPSGCPQGSWSVV